MKSRLQYLHTTVHIFSNRPVNERSAKEIENKQEIDDGPLHQAVAISTIIIRAHMSSIWFMGVLLSAHNEQYQCIGTQNFEGHRTLTQSNWVTWNVNRKLSHRRIPIESHSSHGQNAYFLACVRACLCDIDAVSLLQLWNKMYDNYNVTVKIKWAKNFIQASAKCFYNQSHFLHIVMNPLKCEYA